MNDELTVTEAAERLGVSRSRVMALVRVGRLGARRHGVQLFIPRADVDAYRPRAHGGAGHLSRGAAGEVAP